MVFDLSAIVSSDDVHALSGVEANAEEDLSSHALELSDIG